MNCSEHKSINQGKKHDTEVKASEAACGPQGRESVLEITQAGNDAESFAGWPHTCETLASLEEVYRSQGLSRTLARAAAKCSMQFVLDRNETGEELTYEMG